MKTLFKLVLLLVIIGVGVGVYVFWDELTPGERYHLVDKARTGDVDSLADTVKFKAGEQLDRTKEKAAKTVKEISDKAVDAAADSAKQGIDSAAGDAKNEVRSKVDAELGTAESAEAVAAGDPTTKK